MRWSPETYLPARGGVSPANRCPWVAAAFDDALVGDVSHDVSVALMPERS